MIKLKDLTEHTGFKSFLACFKWLKRDKYDHLPYVKCVKQRKPQVVFGQEMPPMKFADDDFTIPVIEIKAAALEELFAQLPSRADLEKISQSIDSLMPNHRREEVLEILSKIPTK